KYLKYFFFQAEDGIRDRNVTGVQTCALPISERTRALIQDHGEEGNFIPSESIEDFVASLERPRKAIIMVQAGAATDAVIEQLADAMDDGDIIIDGGNALYTDTIRREKEMAQRNRHFVGAGIS